MTGKLSLAFLLALIFAAPSGAADFQCTLSATVNVAAGATAQIAAGAAGKSLRVCGFVITAAATGTAKFVAGTGTNCATGQSDLTAAMAIAGNGNVSLASGHGSLFRSPQGQALCLTAVTGTMTGFVNYQVF